MEGINDIDIEDIKISSKEIKVDVDELKNLFQVIQILINENEIKHMENWEDIACYIDYLKKILCIEWTKDTRTKMVSLK